jgi:NADH:ubiquinone oxidoreductase subunit E
VSLTTRGGASEGSNPGLSIEMSKVNAIFDRYTTWRADEALIPLLQELQHEFGYVPDVLVNLISERFDLPVTQIYGVTTFYSDFRALKQAEHRILLCEGSACYLCGSQTLHKAVKEKLGIDYGETTPDNKFILERANFCFGNCALSPMVELDHTFYSRVTPEELVELIDEIAAGGGGHHSH